jgi:uncharacterized membrane protein YjfL (UPF0719 family)
MSLQQIIFGLLELLLSISTSFILIFGSYRLFLIITPRFDEERQLKKNNQAVGIVLGSIFLGEALVVKQAIYPAMSVIQIFVLEGERSLGKFLAMIGLGAGYVILSGILALASILFSLWIFTKMTPKLDEYEEIKKNNMAVALFVAFFVLSICLLLSSGVAGLTRALIPFPDVGAAPFVQ